MSINHLNIEQATSSIEVVSPSVIDKLYELALNPSLDSGSNVQGNLQVVHAYEDEVSYLTNKFPNLQINVTGGAYIRFADSAVATICATNWGDGTGITTLQAATVSSLNSKFQNNTKIVSFDELVKFTGITTLGASVWNGNSEFYNCTSLTVVYLNNITTLKYNAFKGCSSIENINLPNCTSIYRQDFRACSALKTFIAPSAVWADADNVDIKFTQLTNLKEVNLSSYTGYLWSFIFQGCTSLTTVDVSNISTIGGFVFANCTGLKHVTFNSLTAIYADHTFSGSRMDYIKILSTTMCTLENTNCFEDIGNMKIYVPDDLVATYKVATNWSTYASRIFSLTQFAIDFPNG